MADTSVKLRTLEGGVPKERDPAALLAGVVPQIPIIIGGQSSTIGERLAAASDAQRFALLSAYLYG